MYLHLEICAPLFVYCLHKKNNILYINIYVRVLVYAEQFLLWRKKLTRLFCEQNLYGVSVPKA